MRNNIKIKLSLILKILILINILFICFYEFSIKEYILNVIQNNPDYFDRVYYKNIFDYLEYPLITITLLFIIVLRYKNYIRLILSNISNKRHLLIFILSSVVIIQLGLIIFIKNIPFSDSAFYIKLADRLFSTGSYTSDYGFKTAFWPVGLPAFLTFLHLITNHYILAAKLINIVIFISLVFITYKLFYEHLNPIGRVIYLLSFAFFPNNLFSVNVILTEFPFTLLIWIIIYLVIKFPLKKAIIVGILLAISSYIRPIGLLLPLVIIFYYTKFYGLKKSLKYLSVILIVFLISLAPWTVRNYQLFGKLVPVATNGGFNFLMGNHANSNGDINFNFNYDISNPSEPEESLIAYMKGFESTVNNYIQAVFRLPKKIFFSYFRGDSSITWSLKKTKYSIYPIFASYAFFFTNYLFYLVIVLSIISFYTLFRRDRTQLRFIMNSVYILFILMIIIYVGNERYLIPILPIHFYYFSVYFK